MWFLQSPTLRRGTCSRILFSRQVLSSLLHLWRLLDLLPVIYRCLNHTLRPHRRRFNPVVNRILALRAREALLDSLLDHLRPSDPLPLPDSNLAGRVVRVSRRSLPEPPRSGGGFSEVGALSLSGGRRLPSQLLVGLEGSGGGRLGGGGSAGWLSDPLRPSTSSIRAPSLPAGVLPTVHQGSRLNPGASKPSSEGGSRTSPSVSGFYSRLFLVQKASGSWRPIIDLSTLNDYITSSHFHMETPQSVLRSIRPGDWMVSLDLQDAYLQVPVHHDSRRYLRFVVAGKSYQFRVLCFGLTTAPQVFTRIMAPVSAILHRYGVRMLRYLDDWLILASTELACLQSRGRLLSICTELGIQVNLTKSSLVPTQSLVYLGMEIRSLPFIARPTPVRVNNLLLVIEKFLPQRSSGVVYWATYRPSLFSSLAGCSE